MTWTEGINNDLDIPRGSFGIYWYDRGPEDEAGIEKAIEAYQRTGDYAALPYNAKKALYQRTHDKKLLVVEAGGSREQMQRFAPDIAWMIVQIRPK